MPHRCPVALVSFYIYHIMAQVLMERYISFLQTEPQAEIITLSDSPLKSALKPATACPAPPLTLQASQTPQTPELKLKRELCAVALRVLSLLPRPV